jgi:hypothetical protein
MSDRYLFAKACAMTLVLLLSLISVPVVILTFVFIILPAISLFGCGMVIYTFVRLTRRWINMNKTSGESLSAVLSTSESKLTIDLDSARCNFSRVEYLSNALELKDSTYDADQSEYNSDDTSSISSEESDVDFDVLMKKLQDDAEEWWMAKKRGEVDRMLHTGHVCSRLGNIEEEEEDDY